ncbi:MAG: putative 2-aminoethylphosphonate ABC transporter ATP-binding protein [Dongiaceae bacterium]
MSAILLPSANGTVAATPYLRIERLSKYFDRTLVVDDVSLDVYPGEFVCILGPSGCGKTTLLRAVAGLDIQTRGRIFQDGQDVSTLPASARDVGIVFQSYALFPNLSIERNIGYGLASRGVDRAAMNARIAELLDLVGIADHRKKYPAQLSGGQQQRVALARALAMSPGLLLLDEPLSALDARVRVRLREEIRALQRRLKVTTIMVTHDQEEALSIADRIVLMNKGVIEQAGSPREIYSTPASAFVAQFIGEMNFLPVTVGGPELVRLGNIELRCSIDGLPANAPATLCIRPEDIAVRSVGTSTTNAIPVHIVDLEFRGAFCRARLNGNGQGIPDLAADFSANAVRDLELATGRTVTVALPQGRIRVFARDRA